MDSLKNKNYLELRLDAIKDIKKIRGKMKIPLDIKRINDTYKLKCLGERDKFFMYVGQIQALSYYFNIGEMDL